MQDDGQILAVPTGEQETIWVNEHQYINVDNLIQQVVPFIYQGLINK